MKFRSVFCSFGRRRFARARLDAGAGSEADALLDAVAPVKYTDLNASGFIVKPVYEVGTRSAGAGFEEKKKYNHARRLRSIISNRTFLLYHDAFYFQMLSFMKIQRTSHLPFYFFEDASRFRTFFFSCMDVVNVANARRSCALLYDKALLNSRQAKLLRNVANILLQNDSEYCINVSQVFETDETLLLVTQRFREGMLEDWYALQRARLTLLQERLVCAKYIASQVLRAFSYLHSRQICCRDFNSESCAVADVRHVEVGGVAIDLPVLKLVRFDHATAIAKMRKPSCKIWNLIHHCAPEVLVQSYEAPADVWALGVFLYELLTGKPCFSGFHDEVVKDILAGYFPDFSSIAAVDPDCVDLLKRMLVYNQANRISASAALAHPWLAGVSILRAPEQRGAEARPALSREELRTRLIRAQSFSVLDIFVRLLLVLILPEDEIPLGLRALFSELDVNFTEAFSTAQLSQFIESVLPEASSDVIKRIAMCFCNFELNTVGRKQFFLGLLDLHSEVPEYYFKFVFAKLNRSRSGVLTFHEFKSVFKHLHDVYLTHEAVRLFQYIRTFADFRKYMLRI